MTTHYLIIGNKKVPYVLTPATQKNEYGEWITHVKCEMADIDQDFLSEDIPNLLVDLPKLIEAEEEYQKTLRQRSVIRFRVSEQDKQNIELNAKKRGFNSVSAFLRAVALEDS